MRIAWRDLEEFPDYQISELGEIVRSFNGAPLRPAINQQGIVKIGLVKDRIQLSRSVALLVAKTFVDGRTEIFDTPIHLDGNRQNCTASNLMWRPRWFAIKYHKQFDNDTFQTSYAKLVCVDTDEIFHDLKSVCITYGLHWYDVVRSYIEGRDVFPTGQTFVQMRD